MLRTRAGRRVAEPAAVDALADDGDLPVREGDPEAEGGEVASRHPSVLGGELSGGGKARQFGNRLPEEPAFLARRLPELAPVSGRQPQIGERIADGAQLPVDDCPDRAVRADDRVQEMEV